MSNGHTGAPPFNGNPTNWNVVGFWCSGFSGIGGVAPTGNVNSMGGLPMSTLPGMANISSKLGGALMLSMSNTSALGTPNSGKIGTGSKHLLIDASTEFVF